MSILHKLTRASLFAGAILMATATMVPVEASAMPNTVMASPQKKANKPKTRGGGGGGGATTRGGSAPELSGSAAGGAAALLIGGALVVAGRRRRRG